MYNIMKVMVDSVISKVFILPIIVDFFLMANFSGYHIRLLHLSVMLSTTNNCGRNLCP